MTSAAAKLELQGLPDLLQWVELRNLCGSSSLPVLPMAHTRDQSGQI